MLIAWYAIAIMSKLVIHFHPLAIAIYLHQPNRSRVYFIMATLVFYNERNVTQSEKKALLAHFMVLQETRKHENINHWTKNFLFYFMNLHCLSYLLIYNLPCKVCSF